MTKAEEAALMRDVGGHSIQEIADHFGWSGRTTQDMIHRGRHYKKFKKHHATYSRECTGGNRREDKRSALLLRNSKIVQSVHEGRTMTEVASIFGVSTQIVARALRGSGVKVSHIPSAVDRANAIRAQAQKALWADPIRKAERIAAISNALRNPQ
jgi:transposase-like protein